MDHEKLPCCTPELGMCASDQDLFERVWKRVMPEERADCPIVTAAQAQTAPASLEEEPVHSAMPMPEVRPTCDCKTTPQPEPEPAPGPASEPEPTPEPVESEPEPTPEPSTPTGDDFPNQDAVPCLGSGSAGHGTQLQEDILSALESWQLYRHLARRVTGSAARTLSALASEKHRQARRLAAAYFLISGVRYWPTDKLAVPRTASWLGTLRRRFNMEQQLENRFRTAALDTDDACLSELYTELADGCAAQAGVLRVLLENAL